MKIRWLVLAAMVWSVAMPSTTAGSLAYAGFQNEILLQSAQDDPWQFEEDEAPVETWGQLVRDHALDLGLFVAFSVLVLTSVFQALLEIEWVI